MARARCLSGAAVLAMVSAASGQTILYGFKETGEVIRIDPTTGAGVLAGNCGVACRGAADFYTPAGRGGAVRYVFAAGGAGGEDQIAQLRWWSADVATTFSLGYPAGSIRGMAHASEYSGTYYILVAQPDPGAVEQLAIYAGSTIGSTGHSDLTAIAIPRGGGPMYALGTDGGGTLYSVDRTTGALTTIGGGGFDGDALSMAFMPDGTLLACGSNLRRVDPQTGATTLIGPTGFTGIRAMTAVSGCYVDCDPGGPVPFLNVNDFICFQVRFVQGDLYANCDLSTTPPVLNVNDFICFQRRFIAGCSAP